MKDRNESRRLPLRSLANTRDLGGMKTADGRRIRGGKMIRSGQLYFAAEEDIRALAEIVGTVIDLRSEAECAEKPDPAIPGAEYLRLPPLRELVPGAARDRQSDSAAVEMLARDPGRAMRHMCDIYAGFIANGYSVSQYRRFVRIFLEEHEKAVLWHCTAGKDRAGFGAILLQELLGVDRASILADYMRTAEYLEPEILQLTDMIGKKLGEMNAEIESALRCMFAPKEEFFNILYREADRRFGGFEAFLSEGIGITERDRETLKEICLEE